MPQAPERLQAYGVKERLRSRWAEAHAGERGGGAPSFPVLCDGDFAGPRQRTLFALLNGYRDALLPAYPYPTKCARLEKLDTSKQTSHILCTGNIANAVRVGMSLIVTAALLLFPQDDLWVAEHVCFWYAESLVSLHGVLADLPSLPSCLNIPCLNDRSDAPDALLDAVLLHCLNHCAKAADRVKAGNERLKAGDGVEVSRDQGFTRPKARAGRGFVALAALHF